MVSLPDRCDVAPDQWSARGKSVTSPHGNQLIPVHVGVADIISSADVWFR
jgi:hypothetical protein